jgi:hypothetical protein
MAKSQGTLIFDDWIKPLSKIPDKDFKIFMMSFLLYASQDETPPIFSKVSL